MNPENIKFRCKTPRVGIYNEFTLADLLEHDKLARVRSIGIDVSSLEMTSDFK